MKRRDTQHEPVAPRAREARELDEPISVDSAGSRDWLLDPSGLLSDELVRGAQELFFRVFRANPAPITISRLADGRFVDANDRFCDLLGFERTELAGRTAEELALWPDPATRQALVERLCHEGSLRDLEARLTDRNGQPRDVLVSIEQVELNGEALVVSMFTDVTAERHARAALAESERRELRRLADHLQRAREEEKAAMAREIHDRFGQALTALRLDLSWMARRLDESDDGVLAEALRERLAGMSQQVDETLGSVDHLLQELRPAVLDTLGLDEAVRWQVAEFARRTGLSCTCRARPCGAVGRGRSTTLFRILQEALTNVARHAEAQTVRVHLERAGGRIVLEVEDDGRGADAAALEHSEAYGVLGMKERAAAWGGTVEIHGRLGAGTLVTASVPVGRRGNR